MEDQEELKKQLEEMTDSEFPQFEITDQKIIKANGRQIWKPQPRVELFEPLKSFLQYINSSYSIQVDYGLALSLTSAFISLKVQISLWLLL